MASSDHTVLLWGPTVTARVHPVVIFSICYSYVRRSDQADRVIGTLLGSVSPDGTVDIRNCYAVPYNEQGNVVDSPYLFPFTISPQFERNLFLFRYPVDVIDLSDTSYM